MVIKRPDLNSKFQELLRTFDKKYLEELFEEGNKIGAFTPIDKPIEGIQYIYNGYLYQIERRRVIKGSNVYIPEIKENKRR